MPVFFRRLRSSIQDCGRYKRYATGILVFSVVTERLTATRQLSCFPTCPQYCRATPTDSCPFLGNPVSSTTHATTGSRRNMAGITKSRLRSSLVRHSMGHRQPHDAATDASVVRCLHRVGRPSVQRFCVRPATADPYSNSSAERGDRHALRLLPGPQYMPQSAVPVGLAQSFYPQNNSTLNCSFITQ